MKFKSMRRVVALASVALLIAGCGGGGGASGAAPDTGAGDTTTTPVAARQIIGTSATGAALANASVAITDSSGTSPCVETTITTSALGSYTCTLQTGKTAPFFVVVTDPTGNTPPLVSVSTVTPAAGATLTINATPLTTAIVAQLATDGNPLSVVSARSVDATALQTVTANVVAQLASVLSAIGAPAGYDPFTTSITAATADGTGNTADMVLDVVKVITDPATGKLALSTVDNPTPVPLATASSGGSAVAAPDPAVASLSQAAQIAAKTFNTCFALPTAQRVLSTDTTITAANGGPAVDSVAPECEEIVSDSTNAGGVDYLHNGFDAGQMFYGILTNDTMTGAKFSVPEIMAFYPKDSAATPGTPAALDRAVMNIRYIDADGNPGNAITVAAKLPNTSSADRPTDWWLVGNQQPVDVVVRLNIRRVEQTNPATTTVTTAKFSTYQNGIQFNVNAYGPGSVDLSGNLAFARISGPGLPGNGAPGTGLVYKVSSQTSQPLMDLFSKTGSLTAGSQCGNGTTFNCPNLWFSRTAGLAGTAAATLAANPAGLIWAQTADNIDATQFVKGAKYKIELFYGASTTPLHTFSKTLLSDLVPATQAVNLPWNTLGPQSLAALDPNGALTAAQSALPVDWIQNVSAQQIGNVQTVVNSATGSFGPSKFVPRGATSVVVDNQTVPAFGPTQLRTLLLGYRMLDSSGKTAAYTFN